MTAEEIEAARAEFRGLSALWQRARTDVLVWGLQVGRNGPTPYGLERLAGHTAEYDAAIYEHACAYKLLERAS